MSTPESPAQVPETAPVRCLCSHPEDHHWIFGDCMHKGCGCQSWRPDVQGPGRPQRETRTA